MGNKDALSTCSEKYNKKMVVQGGSCTSLHKVSLLGCKMLIIRSMETLMVGKVGIILNEGNSSLKFQIGSQCFSLSRKGLYGKVFMSEKSYILNLELFGPHRKRFAGLVKSQVQFVGV